MRRDELQDLALLRLREAQALLDAGFWSGSYYLSGYAIELALKACIARQFRAETIPDRQTVNNIWTHDSSKLLGLAKLKPDFEERRKISDRFEANWDIARGWNETARYGNVDEEKARAMLEALSDKKDGVFEWIRSKW